ncbi:hypothetical protein NMG60_11025644 [Bertholletia excelsa]
MATETCACFNRTISPPVAIPIHPSHLNLNVSTTGVAQNLRRDTLVPFAAKSGGSWLGSITYGCKTCGGKGAIECPGCKGTGKNKKNGNIFERWKCFECQGFGLKSCPSCGKGGLTPEQRGER